MQKSILTYMLVALMLSAAIIYFVAASEEGGESTEGDEQEQATIGRTNDIDNDNDEVNTINTNGSESTDALATQVQTAFFTIVGIGYGLVGVWMLKSKNRTNVPYIIAIAGSVLIIGLYVASRTMALPIVGLQDDVGVLDIMSKVLQVFIIGIAASVISYNNAIKIPAKQSKTR